MQTLLSCHVIKLDNQNMKEINTIGETTQGNPSFPWQEQIYKTWVIKRYDVRNNDLFKSTLIIQQAHDVRTALYRSWNDVKTLKRRRNNVVLTPCAGWAALHHNRYDTVVTSNRCNSRHNKINENVLAFRVRAWNFLKKWYIYNIYFLNW